MASYLERTQLLPVQQVLPASESMLKMFQTRLDLYGRGAAMINQQEAKLKQTKLTRESSKNTFSSLMNQVDSNLRSASTMDFSVMDNVNLAAQSFNPLYANTPEINNMWGDKYVTEKFNRDISMAESQRGTDKFNQAGYDWVNAKKEMFRLDPRDESWKMYASMTGDYTEYYDKTKEMADLANLYDKYSKDNLEYKYPDPNSQGYMRHIKDQSFSGEDFSHFVMANGSTKLKKQLQDEALGDYGKYFTGIQNTDLTPEQKTQAINSAYKSKFDNLKLQRMNVLDSKERQALVAMNGLDKSAPDYHEKLENAKMFLKNISDSKKQVASQEFDNEVGTFTNPIKSVEFIKNLHIQDWYSNVSSSWDKKDKLEEMTEDNVYWNRLNYNFNVTKFNESVRQFEKNFDQSERAMQMKSYIEAEKLKLEYRKEGLNPDGTPLDTPNPAGTSYAVPELDDSKTMTPEDIGKRAMDERQQIIDTNAATTHNTLLKMYFKQGDSKLSETFFDEMDNARNINTPFKSIVTTGGVEMRDRVIEYLQNYNIYNKTTGKGYTKDQLMEMTSGQIKQLLHQTLDNPKNLDLFKKLAKDKENGLQILNGINDLEEATRNIKLNFDSKHGYEVSKELKKIGWPRRVDPIKDKELWDKGIRGYEQEQGRYRVPTESEINQFFSNPYYIVSEDAPTFKNPLTRPNTPEGREAVINNWAKNKKEETIKNIYSAVGSRGKPRLNKLETPIDYKNASTKTSADKPISDKTAIKNMILSVLQNPKDVDENTQKLISFGLQHIERVSTVLIRSDKVTGGAEMSLLFDKSDNSIVSALESFNFNGSVPEKGKIYIKVHDRSLIPKQFLKDDPEYLRALQEPISFTRTYDVGGKKEQHVISLRNEGGWGIENSPSPSFMVTGTTVVPMINNGVISRDDQGNVLTQTYSVTDPSFLSSLGINPNTFVSSLQKDPVAQKERLREAATRNAEMISFLNGEARGLTWSQIVENPNLAKKLKRITTLKF